MKHAVIIPALALGLGLAAPQARAAEFQTLSFDADSRIDLQFVKKGGGGGKRGFGGRSRGGFGKHGGYGKSNSRREASDFTDNRSRAFPFFSQDRGTSGGAGDTFVERLFQF